MLEGLALRTTVFAGVLVLKYCWWRHPQLPEVPLDFIQVVQKLCEFLVQSLSLFMRCHMISHPFVLSHLDCVLHVIVTCCLQIWRCEMQSFADFHLSRTYSVMTVTCARIGFLIFVRPVALRTDIAQLELGIQFANSEHQESAGVIYMRCVLLCMVWWSSSWVLVWAEYVHSKLLEFVGILEGHNTHAVGVANGCKEPSCEPV